MCSESTVKCLGGRGGTGARVDTGKPEYTLEGEGSSAGTGTALLKVTDNNYTSSVKVVWTATLDMPTSGWLELSTEELAEAKSGGSLTLDIRKEAGEGASNGKWYLHVMASYDGTGATEYKSVEIDFGTAASPAPGTKTPTLSVNADDSAWAASRAIHVSVRGDNIASVKYKSTSDTSWTDITSMLQSDGTCNVDITKNSYYTFLLTAGDQTVTVDITIQKVDDAAPTAKISAVTAGDSTTAKEGVYPELTFLCSRRTVSRVSGRWNTRGQNPPPCRQRGGRR